MQKNLTSLEVDSDSEEETLQNDQNQKPPENVTESNTNEDEKTSDVQRSQTEVKTSNEGEEDEDNDDDDKSHCHCINPLDYIDINQTKYYDATVIFSSFANFALTIILIIHFYHNKQWTFFGVSLSFHIFSHLCYIFTVCGFYDFKLRSPCYQSICTDKMIHMLYVIVFFVFSPFINLFIYLTSADHLILTDFLKPIIESNITKASPSSSWFEKQLDRLFGYVLIETLFSNVPQCCIELVVIYHCIYDSNSKSNYNSSMRFYLFLAFYLNLFSIVVKSCVPLGCLFDSHNMFKEKSLEFMIAATADFSTTIYLIIWMYVYFVFFL